MNAVKMNQGYKNNSFLRKILNRHEIQHFHFLSILTEVKRKSYYCKYNVNIRLLLHILKEKYKREQKLLLILKFLQCSISSLYFLLYKKTPFSYFRGKKTGSYKI